MNPPLVFPDDVQELDHYQRAAWYERIREYMKQNYLCAEQVRFGHLWRVGIFEFNGRLVRFFYGRQAKIVITIWQELLTNREKRAAPGGKKSIQTQGLTDKPRKRSRGKNKGGNTGGNLR